MKGIITHLNSQNPKSLLELRQEYTKFYPNANSERIESIVIDRFSATYINREKYTNIMDTKSDASLSINNSSEHEFMIKNMGVISGHCKFQMRPIIHHEIRFIDNSLNGEMFKLAITKNRKNNKSDSRLLTYQKLTFHYLAETIFQFCDKNSISQIEFTIEDLLYHPIDSSPTKYSIFMNYKLKELMKSNTFENINK